MWGWSPATPTPKGVAGQREGGGCGGGRGENGAASRTCPCTRSALPCPPRTFGTHCLAHPPTCVAHHPACVARKQRTFINADWRRRRRVALQLWLPHAPNPQPSHPPCPIADPCDRRQRGADHHAAAAPALQVRAPSLRVCPHFLHERRRGRGGLVGRVAGWQGGIQPTKPMGRQAPWFIAMTITSAQDISPHAALTPTDTSACVWAA